MKVIVNCSDMRIEMPVGPGRQHIRWLALAVATRIQREKYPHAFRVPQRVLNNEGVLLKPRQIIAEALEDGEEVTVELRKGAQIHEDDLDSREWLEDSYGAQSNLMDCKFRWKVDAKVNQGIPRLVRGDFVVHPKWLGVYPQRDYGGPFEIPVEPIEVGPDQVDWIASRKGPPGSCTYKFIMNDDTEEVCKASPETMAANGDAHFMEFFWDVPIAPEPYPELDSRPSTASSRDGAQVDPRFESDWDSMRLRWVESFMKVRVKDVLTEFYAILIDLFDSYAFMGLDLSANQHTIGMDDWKHLILNCGLLQGQPEGSLAWREVCKWFEDASNTKDSRPYLAQRLTRSHYLELLMRTAGWVMCEHPRAQYMPQPGKPPMPLDEGLFRFITDILIPVMDVYDDDPIRKDAVQNENLVVIQKSRASIRSAYAFLAQPWPYSEGEPVVVPRTLRFVFEFALEKLTEEVAPAPPAEEGKKPAEGEAAPEAAKSGPDFVEILGAEGMLTPDQLNVIVKTFDASFEKVTMSHPEPPEEKALLFWEFFEVLMQCCREVAPACNTSLHEAIPATVQTLLAFMSLADQGLVAVPDALESMGEEEGADEN
jgi:hypothetical protein